MNSLYHYLLCGHTVHTSANCSLSIFLPNCSYRLFVPTVPNEGRSVWEQVTPLPTVPTDCSHSIPCRRRVDHTRAVFSLKAKEEIKSPCDVLGIFNGTSPGIMQVLHWLQYLTSYIGCSIGLAILAAVSDYLYWLHYRTFYMRIGCSIELSILATVSDYQYWLQYIRIGCGSFICHSTGDLSYKLAANCLPRLIGVIANNLTITLQITLQ